jgi:hypothetical protein
MIVACDFHTRVGRYALISPPFAQLHPYSVVALAILGPSSPGRESYTAGGRPFRAAPESTESTIENRGVPDPFAV